mmetsp:Transcript_13955/g.32764  ORF Transcript_13955/g.32764 Transcript_13955/m.32764 type:complete len:319 (+) Transcript_13955:1273-2229(+)
MRQIHRLLGITLVELHFGLEEQGASLSSRIARVLVLAESIGHRLLGTWLIPLLQAGADDTQQRHALHGPQAGGLAHCDRILRTLQPRFWVGVRQVRLRCGNECLGLAACIPGFLVQRADLAQRRDCLTIAVLPLELDRDHHVHCPRLVLLVVQLAGQLICLLQRIIPLTLGNVHIHDGPEGGDLSSLVPLRTEGTQCLHCQPVGLVILLEVEEGVRDNPEQSSRTLLLHLALQFGRAIGVGFAHVVAEDVFKDEFLLLRRSGFLEHLGNLLQLRQRITEHPLLGLDVGLQVERRGLALLVSRTLEQRQCTRSNLCSII